MDVERLILHIKAVAQYVQGKEDPNTAIAIQLPALKAMIENHVSGPAVAAQVEEVCKAHLAEYMSNEKYKELQEVLDKKAAEVAAPVSTLAAAGGGHNKTQEWSNVFWKQMPTSLMDTLRDITVQNSEKMSALFDYLLRLGLKHPSEKTYACILALFYYTLPGALPSGQELHMMYVNLKQEWRNWVDRSRLSLNQNHVQEHFPGHPVGQKLEVIDQFRFVNIIAAIPLRSTNVRSSLTASSSRQWQRPLGMMHPAPKISYGKRLALMAAPADAPANNQQMLALMPPPEENSQQVELEQQKQKLQEMQRQLEEKHAALQKEKSEMMKPAGSVNKGGALAQVTAALVAKMEEKTPKKTKNKAVEPKASAKKVKKQQKPKHVIKKKSCQAETDGSKSDANPASSKKAGPSEAIRNEMRTGSLEKRTDLYMKHGCSKCVWKPGCTPSCWRYRKMEKPED